MLIGSKLLEYRDEHFVSPSSFLRATFMAGDMATNGSLDFRNHQRRMIMRMDRTRETRKMYMILLLKDKRKVVSQVISLIE